MTRKFSQCSEMNHILKVKQLKSFFAAVWHTVYVYVRLVLCTVYFLVSQDEVSSGLCKKCCIFPSKHDYSHVPPCFFRFCHSIQSRNIPFYTHPRQTDDWGDPVQTSLFWKITIPFTHLT